MPLEAELDNLRARMAQVQIDFAAVIEGLKKRLEEQDMRHVIERTQLVQQIVDLKAQLTTAREAAKAMDDAAKRMEAALSKEAKS